MDQQPETKNRPPDNKTPTPSPRRWWSLIWYALLAVLLLTVWQDLFNQVTVRNIPYSEFKEHVARKEVTEASLRQDEIRGTIAPKPEPAAKGKEPAAKETPAEPFDFRTVRVEDPKLVEALQAAGVKFTGVRPSFLSEVFWTWVVPLGLLFLLWTFLARRLGASREMVFGFGKSPARLVADKDTRVT